MASRSTPIPSPSSYTSSALTPSSAPRPIQYTPIRPEDFQLRPDSPNSAAPGIAFLNQTLSQITTTLNALLGQGGPVQFPAGVDMSGAKLTGIPAPTSPTDAISSGHASTQFSAAAQQPQLDVGGQYALKGLTYSYQQATQVPTLSTQITNIISLLAAGTTGTITIPKLTGGGTNGSITVGSVTIGGITIKGIITAFTNPT